MECERADYAIQNPTCSLFIQCVKGHKCTESGVALNILFSIAYCWVEEQGIIFWTKKILHQNSRKLVGSTKNDTVVLMQVLCKNHPEEN